jgi:hypothetical protein
MRPLKLLAEMPSRGVIVKRQVNACGRMNEQKKKRC